MAPRLSLLLQSAARKLRRSLSQRGLAATALRCATRPWLWAWHSLRHLTPANRRYRRQERDFDRRLNIDTLPRAMAGGAARIASPNWRHDAGYAPAPIDCVRSILAGLEIDFPRFTLIDFGAGKGRILFLAAELPFKRIVGVEFSPALFEILQRNLASARQPERRCGDIVAVMEDATRFLLPDEPLALFFHHPFEAPVFQAMLERIERSLAQAPREMWVVYYDPQCAALFDQSPFFERRRQGERDPKISRSNDWIVWSTRSTV